MIDYAANRSARSPFARRRKKIISTFFIVSIVGMVLIFIFSIGAFAWFAKDLPNPNEVQRKDGFSTIIFDRNGKELYDIYADENRIPITIEQVPDNLKHATVAIEDKTFYEHQGYSTRGIIRAFFTILTSGQLQGGSTLTQQLVKNVLLTSERTLPRKIKEFILAVQIERKYSKDEILQMYLNEAPYGGTAWGVESAAQSYFSTSVSELDLTQSAFIAGLPQNPSWYSPYIGDENAYIGRAEHVLRRMREDGYISKEQEEAAKLELPHLTFAGKATTFPAPHFVEYIRKQLEDQFGNDVVSSGGLRVTTTLDLALQKASEEIMFEEIEKVKGLNVGNGSTVVLNPATGEILAMVGSKQYDSVDEEEGKEEFQGKFNVAVQGLRQPGSALKPLVYAAAFERGYTPSSIVMDVPTSFPGGKDEKPYEPKNYDGKFRGPVQMRFALGNSVNVTAVKTLGMVGVRDMLQLAYDMGLHTLEPTTENMNRFGLSLALGGGEVRLIELTSAYGVFATGGVRQEPVGILKIEDKNGKTVFEFKQKKGDQILDKNVAFLISHILSDNNARVDVFGPNSWLHIAGKEVAVKTGTTDDKRDNWTVGFTKEVVIGVWVGNNDNSPMNEKLASGVTGAAPIWNRIMREALKTYSDGITDKPSDIDAIEIDALAGGLPKDGRPVRSEYFIKGTEPTSSSSVYQRLKISRRQSGKLASDDEVRVGDYEEKEYIVWTEDDPVSGDGKNRWQEGINTWVKDHPDPLYRVPTEKSDVKIEDKKEEEKKEDPTPTPTNSPSETPTPTPILTIIPSL